MGTSVELISPILFNMRACILLLALAVAVQAQKFEPVTCDYEKGEMMCSGKWNEDWTEQLTADFCIPMKNGDCYNDCPKDCGKDEMMCPGMTHADGCKDADYCVPEKFCPANCDWEKEMMCPGKWNEDWTEQISGDFCIPMKNGDCYNACPKDCGKDEMMCPGAMDPKGCPMPDMCFPAGKDCPKM